MGRSTRGADYQDIPRPIAALPTSTRPATTTPITTTSARS